MKKITLLSFAIFMSMCSFAQVKAEAGAVATEIGVQLASPMVKVNSLKVRYFLSEQLVVRADLGFGLDVQKVKVDDPDTKTEGSSTETVSNFSVMVGGEYHLGAGDRLSPYVGAQLGYASEGYKSIGEMDIAGATSSFEYKNVSAGGTPKGYSSFGVGVFTGFDFYIYKGLYTGAEFGVQYMIGKAKDWESTIKTGTTETTDKSDETIKESVSSLSFSAVPTIKIGWCF